MKSNSLKLNSDKTEVFVAISQHNKLHMPPVSLTIGNEVIQTFERVRNLGVIFDTYMTMSSQISSLCRSVSYHLWNISRIQRFLDYNTCNDIVCSPVLSRLDFGNVLLMGANAKQIARLKVLQNWAAKLIFSVAKKIMLPQLLKQLHWLPIKERVYFKTMLYIFKCLAGSGPAYLTSGLTLYKPGHEGLRSANNTSRLTKFKIQNWTLTSAVDKAFFYAAPKQWNKLLIDIRSSSSVTVQESSQTSLIFTNLIACFCILLVVCICLCIFE